MKRYRFIIIGLILCCAFVKLSLSATNYCRLCRNHVGCHPKRGFAKRCGPDRSVVKITDTTKNLLLQLHNGFRSIVASGNLKGFPSARRMAYMKWDDELAKLALINARQCRAHYDKCRKTVKFPWVGQNVGIDRELDGYPNVTLSIYRTMFKWFNEYENANSEIIDAYRLPKRKRGRYNSFTVMVQDRQTHVGCAAVKFQQDDDSYNIYWVCNYAIRNVINRKVYATGTPYAGCELGRNYYFPSLCRPDEPIAAVPYPASTVDGDDEAVSTNLKTRKKKRKVKKKKKKNKRKITNTEARRKRRRKKRKRKRRKRRYNSTDYDFSGFTSIFDSL